VGFPQVRPRRLRRSEALRRLTQETRLSVDSLVLPLFVHEPGHERAAIPSMPGQFRWPVGELGRVARDARDRGIGAVLLFGLPDNKDEKGSGAFDPDGVIQRAVRSLKDAVPEMLVITDTCLDEYTSHGHCGVVVDGEVDNDATLDLLAQTALTQAQAGADIVAPSDMMDGRVQAIREALDSSGFQHVPIMSYAAKYASAFYGPFRDAAECAPQFGDRRSYQMDPPNKREAIREVEMDVEEGADIVMVKPALAYLDILEAVRDRVTVPLAAYNVSGEYAMIEAAAANGWIDKRAAVMEVLTGIARAGADVIITYHACEAAEWLSSCA
jgi:porphobilinogen synthase